MAKRAIIFGLEAKLAGKVAQNICPHVDIVRHVTELPCFLKALGEVRDLDGVILERGIGRRDRDHAVAMTERLDQTFTIVRLEPWKFWRGSVSRQILDGFGFESVGGSMLDYEIDVGDDGGDGD